MSRIGKKEIEIPKGVEVKVNGKHVAVKGPKGTLERTIHDAVKVDVVDSTIKVGLVKEGFEYNKFHGLTRSLINNMVIGVSDGFSKSLTLIGVGYRAAVQGNVLNLTLGYSHPINHEIPQGISVTVDKQTIVMVSGADKELVGQTAANIRSYRKPEPYHGKGVRYSDERIITKVGKTSGKK